MRLIKLLPFAVVVTLAAGLMFGTSSRVEADWPADCLPSATIQFVECFNVGAGDTDVVDDTTVAGDTDTVVTEQNPGWTDPDGAGPDCAIRAEELRVNGATTPQPCVTPPLSGFANYTITFDWGRDVAGATSMTVEYSTDGGSTFQTLEVFTSPGDENTCTPEIGAECATTEHSETLALGCANDTFVLRFVGTTVVDDDYYVDDLLVAGVGEPCTDPDLFITKACVGDEADATYTIDLVPLEGQTDPAPIELACGAQDVFTEVEPGDYTLVELIDGEDAGEITTTIFCIDLPPVAALQTTLTMFADSDQSCVIVNFFDPDAGVDADGDGIPDGLEDLICLCFSLDLEIGGIL